MNRLTESSFACMIHKIEYCGGFMDTLEKSFVQEYIDIYGVRRSNKQKKNFIDFFSGRLKSYQHNVYEQKIGIMKIKMHTYGDINKSDTVFIAGYDTREAKLPGTPPYHPLDASMNRKNDFNNLVLNTIMSLAILVGAFYVFKMSMDFTSWNSFLLKMAALILAAFSFTISRGFTNKKNVSKTIPLYMMDYIANGREDCAFIICDYLSYSKLGFLAIEKQFENLSKKTLIYIDSISMGTDLLVGYTKPVENTARKLSSHYAGPCELELMNEEDDSRFDIFKKLIIVATVSKDSDGYYVKNSNSGKDTQVDVTEVDDIKNAFLSIITNLHSGPKKCDK